MRKNLIYWYYRSFLIIISISFISCNGTAQSKNNCDQIHLISADLKRINSKGILFLIADDRSGSTANGMQPVRMTEQQYRELLQTFIDNGYVGQFAIRIIGNTPHSGFEEALTFDPVFQTKEIPKDLTLTPKARLLCINQRIQDTNRLIINNNKRKINDYINRIIMPKAISYTPNGQDKTDIYAAFRDIEMKINIGNNFNKVIVVVISDGIDSNKKKLTLDAQLPFELILIGWPLDKKVKDQKELHLGSIDDLITWFKNLKI